MRLRVLMLAASTAKDKPPDLYGLLPDAWLNEEIAGEVSLNQRQVGRWRRRWQESFDALVSIDAAAQRPRCVRPSKRFSVTRPGVAVQARLLQNM